MMLQLASDVVIQAIQAPAPSCDWANQISPTILPLLGNVRGLAIAAAIIIVIVGLILLPFLVAFKNSRKRIVEVVGSVLGALLISAGLLAIVTSLAINAC